MIQAVLPCYPAVFSATALQMDQIDYRSSYYLNTWSPKELWPKRQTSGMRFQGSFLTSAVADLTMHLFCLRASSLCDRVNRAIASSLRSSQASWRGRTSREPHQLHHRRELPWLRCSESHAHWLSWRSDSEWYGIHRQSLNCDSWRLWLTSCPPLWWNIYDRLNCWDQLRTQPKDKS